MLSHQRADTCYECGMIQYNMNSWTSSVVRIYLSIYPAIHKPVHPSAHPPIHPRIHLSIHRPSILLIVDRLQFAMLKTLFPICYPSESADSPFRAGSEARNSPSLGPAPAPDVERKPLQLTTAMFSSGEKNL